MNLIEQILHDSHTIAVVGFSSDKSKAGYYVPAYLQQHGYQIIPVNPYLQSGLGQLAYPSLLDLPNPVDLVLIFQRSENVPPFVDQAIQIKAKAIWMQQGIIHLAAAQKAESAGIPVIMDKCMLIEHRHQHPSPTT